MIGGVGHQQGVMGVQRPGTDPDDLIDGVGPTEGVKAIPDIDDRRARSPIGFGGCPAPPKGRITMTWTPSPGL